MSLQKQKKQQKIGKTAVASFQVLKINCSKFFYEIILSDIFVLFFVSISVYLLVVGLVAVGELLNAYLTNVVFFDFVVSV